MENANFIPLGELSARAPFEGREKRIGNTKEERKQIAREFRLKAKKEKKKLKSDAKKQRKLNAILQRRMTRNNEKYSKNKERNKERAIFLERWAIWNGAIHQAERLAAKHDPTGKQFNVGEVVIMPDGSVKSKESLQKAAEAKEQREKEKREVEESKAIIAEAKQAIKEGRLPAQYSGPADGVNPQRQAFIQNLEGMAGLLPKVPQKMSNKQRQRQALYAPRPTPPKPVIPEGYSIPEDEEDFLALWDITDAEINQRIIKQRQKKGEERKKLRRQQKIQQKINKKLKAKKKQAASLGILFDRQKALKEILGQESESKAASDDGSDLDSEASLEFDSDGIEITKSKDRKKTKELNVKGGKEPKVWVKRPKRSSEDAVEDEPMAKKNKNSSEEEMVETAPKPRIVEPPVQKKSSETHAPVPGSKEDRASSKEARRIAKKSMKQLEPNNLAKVESKKSDEVLAASLDMSLEKYQRRLAEGRIKFDTDGVPLKVSKKELRIEQKVETPSTPDVVSKKRKLEDSEDKSEKKKKKKSKS